MKATQVAGTGLDTITGKRLAATHELPSATSEQRPVHPVLRGGIPENGKREMGKVRSKRWYRRRAAHEYAKKELKNLGVSRRRRADLFTRFIAVSMDTLMPDNTPYVVPRKYQDRSKYRGDGSRVS